MKGNALLKPVLLTVGMYLFLKFVLPLFTAPLPSSLIFLYIALTLTGIVIFATLSGASTKAFFGPLFGFLSGEGQDGTMKVARVLVLVVFPLLVGWQTYSSTAPSDQPPAENRTIHPAPPGEFVGLANPISNTPENVMMGKGLYAAFCSPCHGGNFDGKGPAAKGFNPPPANFSDPTTIAMLQESYLFWRVAKGAPGLPSESTPWASAMPAWENFMTEEEIWDVIIFLYDYTGHRPRALEVHE